MNEKYVSLINIYVIVAIMIILGDVINSAALRMNQILSLFQLLLLVFMFFLKIHAKNRIYSKEAIRIDLRIVAIDFFIIGYSVIIRQLLAIDKPWYLVFILLIPFVIIWIIVLVNCKIGENNKGRKITAIERSSIACVSGAAYLLCQKYIRGASPKQFGFIWIILTYIMMLLMIYVYVFFDKKINKLDQ